jgi:hypothetical protein
MPVWQRVIDHIGDQRIQVESRGGNRYPVLTTKDRTNEEVYKFAMGDRAYDELWAWVDHSGDGPATTDWTSTGHPSGGPPDGPPGEH